MNRLVQFSFCQFTRCKQVKCSRRGFSFTSRHHKVKISYAIYPEGRDLDLTQKSPIFILHGLFGSKANWHSLAKRITSVTQRQVVTLDARNHGDSDHSPSMDYLIMHEDLIGVMDTLKVERPVVLGHSMGGKTAMASALTAPERVESLIVVDTAPKESPGADTLRTYAEKMKNVPMPPASKSMPEGRRLVDNELKTFIQDRSVRQFLLKNLKRSADNSFKWHINLDAIINNFDSLHSFPQLSAPCSINTIFIGGAESRHMNSSAQPSICKLFPGSTIKFVPEAGHWVHIDNPAQFVEIVCKFVLTSVP